VIVRSLLTALADLILDRHLALEATFTAAAETGQHLDAVEGGDQTTLHASGVKSFATLLGEDAQCFRIQCLACASAVTFDWNAVVN